MAEEKKKTVQKRTSLDKWKRKTWYRIMAPVEFDKKELAETIVEKPKNLEGRTLLKNLSDLSGQNMKRHIVVKFRINKVEGQQAFTIAIGHEINPGYMSRMIRRRNSKMEVVQTVETSDKKKVRIKTIALSVKKIAAVQKTSVRNQIRDSVAKHSSKKTYDQLMQEIIFGAFASKLFKQAKEIVPIKRLEITKSRLV